VFVIGSRISHGVRQDWPPGADASAPGGSDLTCSVACPAADGFVVMNISPVDDDAEHPARTKLEPRAQKTTLRYIPDSVACGKRKAAIPRGKGSWRAS
jgi:hypothetical protein